MNRLLAVLALVISPLPLSAQSKPADIAFQKDVAYGKGGDVDLQLDLAQPPRGDGPFAAVVCVHGGAWQAGQRGDLHHMARHLAQNGYVAASITYRLAPKHRWPAQIEDVKCAIRFLRANAKKFKIDPDRIAVLGESAGGHLSLLAGLMRAKDDFEGKGGHGDASSQVQAVVNFYGPTDFRTWVVPPLGENLLRLGIKKDSSILLKELLGTADRKEPIMAKASPVAYIHKGAPPILTFNGTQDALVPDAQARELHEALKKAGVTERLEILVDAPHGWGGALREKTNRTTVDFLDKHLKAR